MFNIIETPRNYFTRELLSLHDNLSSIMWHFTLHWRPHLMVSCSKEVFCRPSTALVATPENPQNTDVVVYAPARDIGSKFRTFDPL